MVTIKKYLKKEFIMPVLAVFVAILLAIGASYALFTIAKTGTKSTVINAGTLQLAFADTNSMAISLQDTVPMTDATGMTGTEYKFTLTNTGTLPVHYELKIDENEDLYQTHGDITNNKVFLDNQLRIGLTKNGTTKYISYNRQVLDSGVLAPGASNTYSARIWIDYNVGNEGQGNHFHGTFTVEGVQDDTPLASCFTLDEDGMITSYTCSETEIIIPNTINDVPVTGIGSSAFANKNLTSVVIPENITIIEDNAFANNSLTNVTILGKTNSGDFDSYGSNIFGWADGYTDENIVWIGASNEIYTIEAPDTVYSYINYPLDETKIAKAIVRVRGIAVAEVPASTSSFEGIDVTKTGIYNNQLQYTYEIDGFTLTATSNLEVFEHSAPKIIMTQCTSEDSCTNGTYTSGEWTNYNVLATISTDQYENGSFARYQLYDETTSTWKDLTLNDSYTEYTSAEDDASSSVTKKIRGVDENGNVSAVLTYQINIDKIDPNCTLEVSSGTLGENEWYNTDIGVGFATKEDNQGIKEFGVTESATANYSSGTYTFTKEGTGTVYGYVKDNAGNTNSCSIAVKKDSVAPTISTFTAAKTETYNNLTVKLTLSATDATSKGMKMYLSNSGYQKSGSWATYATSKNWTLSGSLDGVKRTIYLTVKDKAGNTTNKSVTYTPYEECSSTTTTWSGTWGSCSVTCGVGTQKQTGTKYDTNTNKSCGSTSKSQECRMAACNHTHKYGSSYNAISGTHKNYYKTVYHFNGTWTCSSGHTHKATTTTTAYEVQCIHCGLTYREINNREWSNQRLWCPCDVPGLGCQLA